MLREDQSVARVLGGALRVVLDQRAWVATTQTNATIAKLPTNSTQSPLFRTSPLLQFTHDGIRFHLACFEIENQLRVVEDRWIDIH